MAEPLEELKQILAPAGGGMHVVSTGLKEQLHLQRRIYGAATNEQIEGRWHAALSKLDDAKVALLGVPSDTGAGFVRGANRAPSVLRERLLKEPDHPMWREDVVDVGDVRVVPHLLSGEMISDDQLRRSRVALYDDGEVELPVTPLDQCALALDHLHSLAPHVRPVVIGGDHSVGWPAFSRCFAHHEREGGRKVGLLHFDAHTDLLEERLGVRYCFATWAFHANDLLGRDGRLVQLGIRASARDKAHWEKSLGVRQYWPDEVRSRTLDDIASDICARFDERGVDALYVSNDIDGTDIRWAGATGTPEADGLEPGFVRELTRRVCDRFELLGADLVEVAPPLSSGREGEPEITLRTASEYLGDLIELAAR
jgi:agmatinase